MYVHIYIYIHLYIGSCISRMQTYKCFYSFIYIQLFIYLYVVPRPYHEWLCVSVCLQCLRPAIQAPRLQGSEDCWTPHWMFTCLARACGSPGLCQGCWNLQIRVFRSSRDSRHRGGLDLEFRSVCSHPYMYAHVMKLWTYVWGHVINGLRHLYKP